MLARTAIRAVARAAPRGSRASSADAGAGDYFAKRDAVRAHAAGLYKHCLVDIIDT
jgi:cytochrome c oxidase subunit 6a